MKNNNPYSRINNCEKQKEYFIENMNPFWRSLFELSRPFKGSHLFSRVFGVKDQLEWMANPSKFDTSNDCPMIHPLELLSRLEDEKEGEEERLNKRLFKGVVMRKVETSKNIKELFENLGFGKE